MGKPKLATAKELPNVLLIGDIDDYLLHSLLENESPSHVRKCELLLDTKYYTACVKLVSLKTVDEVHKWSVSTENVNVGAVIYSYEGEFRSLQQLKAQMLAWRAEVQAAVCRCLERSADWSENLRRLCAAEGIELIELDPDEETVEELKECCELYGISRIRQVLEAGNWRDKVMKIKGSEREQCVEKENSRCNSSAKKSSDDSLDEKDFDDITVEDREMILKLFGSKMSFDSLVKYADNPDPAVIEYFRQETEKLKRQSKSSAKKRKKKKKAKAIMADEFGEFVGADGSTQSSSNIITQKSSIMSSANNCQANGTSDVQKNIEEKLLQVPGFDISRGCRETAEGNLRDLSDIAKSMIDGLFGKNNTEQEAGKEVTILANKFDKVRSMLSKMSFGPDRQNLAADAMIEMIRTLGAEDLFSGSSDDERRSVIS